jgi:hypothetical protein
MATIDQIRAGIQTRLNTISNLRTPDRVPDTIDPDTAVVRYAGTIYDSTQSRGSDDHRYVVQIFTSRASDRGQDALYEYCDGTGPRSVKAAIEADMRLGGIVDYAEAIEAQEPGTVEVGGVDFYSVEIVVLVGVTP